VYQASKDRHFDFRWLEERMTPLGFCIVLCTRTEDSFAKAREDRLKVSGNPRQYDDLQPFIREQAKFREVVNQSLLPHTEIDVSSGDLDTACDRIADWLTEHDLLRGR
jgi:hypothetical protein